MDCIDDNALNPQGIIDFVNDQVMDYDLADCFESISDGPQTFGEVIEFLQENLPAGQAAGDVDLLFQEYGY
ncbi:MAG: hypothetical protein MI974_02030 [Chitinophagales bacterium]|nr:hypothetical protein [Chitinophagales bacterium]